MSSTRRKFTAEYKTEAAHRVIDSGRSVAEVAVVRAPQSPGEDRGCHGGVGLLDLPVSTLTLEPRGRAGGK